MAWNGGGAEWCGECKSWAECNDVEHSRVDWHRVEECIICYDFEVKAKLKYLSNICILHLPCL